MNHWLDLSIQYANRRNYLDDLFKVYPTIPDGIRDVDGSKWDLVEEGFNSRDNKSLVRALLNLDLFPIKDSYVSYLKRDRSAIERNPETINRLAGRLYDLGLPKIYEKCTEPKETNRQIGPMFRNWYKKGSLGVPLKTVKSFLQSKENAILDCSDEDLKTFAKEHLGYSRNKGLDLIARFNGKYVLAEAKFLTDMGGHQNAQFNDAISTLKTETTAINVAILDGVLYIPGRHKMYTDIHKSSLSDKNIMSALVLREFLYSL